MFNDYDKLRALEVGNNLLYLGYVLNWAIK